jgi:hypothetical protein
MTPSLHTVAIDLAQSMLHRVGADTTSAKADRTYWWSGFSSELVSIYLSPHQFSVVLWNLHLSKNKYYELV